MRIFARFSLFLLPPLIQGGLSFLMMPVTTKVLDAADFGAFALLSSLVGFGGTFASMGSSYLFSAHFLPLDAAGRKGLVSACLLVGTAISLAFVAAFLSLWPIISRSSGFASIPFLAVQLSLLGMALTYPWTLACDITILEGKSNIFAAATIGQSLVVAVSTILGLYVFKLGLMAMFVSGLAGGAVFFLAGGYVLLPFLGIKGLKVWLKRIFKIGPITSMGNISESLQISCERYFLFNYAGLAKLGIYNHSQQYRQMVFTLVKAVTRSIWPSTLKESRSEIPDFSKASKVWAMVHLFLAMVGVFFATSGKEVIAFMTHNKFTAAYPLVSIWMVLLLIKHSGRMEIAYLTAHNHTGFIAALTIITICISIVCMVLLIPPFGMAGALTSMMIQDLGFRFGLTWKARSIRKFGFTDDWVIKGSLLIFATLAATTYMSLGSLQNLVLLAALEAYLLWVAYGKLQHLPGLPEPLRKRMTALEKKEG